MNRDDLVDVIGMIDDDMIEYVDRIRTRKKKRKWIPRMHCGSWIDSRISDCVC